MSDDDFVKTCDRCYSVVANKHATKHEAHCSWIYEWVDTLVDARLADQ